MVDSGTDDASPWELRVHGVAGTTAESMLQAGADEVEYGLPSGLELARGRVVPPDRRAFSWGSLTSGRPSHAFNVLLLPFMLANVAGWTLPSLRRPDDPQTQPTPKARATTAIVRLFGLMITGMFAVFVALVFVDVVAAIIGGRRGAWFGFVLALAAIVAVSLFTTVMPRDPRSPLWPPPGGPMEADRTRRAWFDRNQDALWSTPQTIAHTHRPHTCAAFAVIAATVCGAVLADGTAPGWVVAAAGPGLGLAAACLAGAVVLLVAVSWSAGGTLPVAWSRLAQWWLPALAGGSVVVAGVVVSWLPVSPEETLYGLRGALAAAGAVALVGYVTVGLAEARNRPPDTTVGQAWAGASLLLLSAGVAAVYGAGFLLFGLGLLERFAFGGLEQTLPRVVTPTSLDWVAVAYLLVALAVVILVGARFAWLYRVTADTPRHMAALRRLVRRPTRLLGTLGIVGAAGVVGLIAAGVRCTESVPDATLWSRQLLPVDEQTCLLGLDAADVAWLLAGIVLIVVAALVVVAFGSPWRLLVVPILVGPGLALALGAFGVGPGWLSWHQPVTGVSLSAVAVTVAFTTPFAAILTRAVNAVGDRSTRRGIAVLWDLSQFWPRWFHPFAQRSYSDTAVSGLAALLERRGAAEALTVLAPHSQGSVIAVPAGLLADTSSPGCLTHVALLTYGSPVRQLYCEVFPGMFTPSLLADLAGRLTDGGQVRWRNLWRTTDPIGGPMARDEDGAGVPAVIDELSRPAADGLADPNARLHSGYWEEPTYQLAVDTLWPTTAGSPPPAPTPPGPNDGPPPFDMDEADRRWVTQPDTNRSFEVASAGDGPPVVLLHELNGVSEYLWQLAGELMAQGFTVHVPLLYGDAKPRGMFRGSLRAVRCLRNDLALFTAGGNDGLAGWLDVLVSDIAEDSDHETGVGVIGMCMTGGVVLGALANADTVAVVSSQPALPMRPWSPMVRADLGLTPARLDDAIDTDTPLLCLRYRDDRLSSDRRMDHVRLRFGAGTGEWYRVDGLRVSEQGRLVTVEVPGSRHSVLTAHRDEAALARAVVFLADRLLTAPTGADG